MTTAELLRAEGRVEGLTEGRVEGRVEGQAKTLLRQLEIRFGPVSERVRARVEGATVTELDVWVERVLTAPSLEEVLG